MSDIFRDYSFGGWIRHFRVEKGLSLRKFCEIAGYDVGNYSKLENSELPPPKNVAKIRGICEYLDKPDAADLLISIAFQHHLSELQKNFFAE